MGFIPWEWWWLYDIIKLGALCLAQIKQSVNCSVCQVHVYLCINIPSRLDLLGPRHGLTPWPAIWASTEHRDRCPMMQCSEVRFLAPPCPFSHHQSLLSCCYDDLCSQAFVPWALVGAAGKHCARCCGAGRQGGKRDRAVRGTRD